MNSETMPGKVLLILTTQNYKLSILVATKLRRFVARDVKALANGPG